MRIDDRATLPVWCYVPLALLGAGALLLRTDAFGHPAAAEPMQPAAESDARPFETVPVELSDRGSVASDIAEMSNAVTGVELPVAREDPVLILDPDFRTEADALRAAMDEEQAAGD
jgi:hypothetical protein